MPGEIWVAVISAAGGGLFALLVAVINRKTEAAKNELSKNTVEVEAAVSALGGVQILANQLRLDLDRANQRNAFLEQEAIDAKARALVAQQQLSSQLEINQELRARIRLMEEREL